MRALTPEEFHTVVETLAWADNTILKWQPYLGHGAWIRKRDAALDVLRSLELSEPRELPQNPPGVPK